MSRRWVPPLVCGVAGFAVVAFATRSAPFGQALAACFGAAAVGAAVVTGLVGLAGWVRGRLEEIRREESRSAWDAPSPPFRVLEYRSLADMGRDPDHVPAVLWPSPEMEDPEMSWREISAWV